MKKTGKHHSFTQNYIDISDALAAGRSALVLLYVVIGIALAVSCMMYIVFDIVPVKNKYDSGENVPVECLIQVRGYELQEGDLVVLRKSRLSAVVLQTRGFALESSEEEYQGLTEDHLLVSINEVNGSKNTAAVTPDEIEGKISYVVSPMKLFGADIHKLFG